MSFSLDVKRQTLKWLDVEKSIKKHVKELGVGEVTGNRK